MKFQVFLLSSIDYLFDEKLQEYQSQGWEIAGPITTTYYPAPTNSFFMACALKRKID